MKYALFAVLSCLALLSGCASNQPLTHNYEGEQVFLGSLNIDFQSLDLLPEKERDVFGAFANIRNTVDSFNEVYAPKRREALNQELEAFQDILVTGLGEAYGISIAEPELERIYIFQKNTGEMSHVRFSYAEVDAARLDLEVGISYPGRSTQTYGILGSWNRTVTVKPHISLRVIGKNQQGDTFWNERMDYQSTQSHTFAISYFYNIPDLPKSDGKSFLIPLASGLVEQMPRSSGNHSPIK